MSYFYDQAPADPIISQSSNPSSPPSIEESFAVQTGSALPASSSGLPRFPQVKLTIKLGRETPNSAPQIMTSSVAYRYGSNEDDRETSGDDSSSTPFSGLNAPAVRQRIRAELAAEQAAAEANGRESNADNDSTTGDDATETKQETPKKELRERKRVSDMDPASSSSKKGSGKKEKGGKKGGHKGKKSKKEEKVDGDEKEEEEGEGEGGEDGEEEVEEYEVERILAHGYGDDGELLYKVKWVGYGPEFDTFEPASELGSAKQRIEEYKRSLPVEERNELEGKKKERKRGRPSTAPKSSKKARSSVSLMDSDESEEDEKEDKDDDFKLEKKTPGVGPTRTGRGRPPKSKGELKLFESPALSTRRPRDVVVKPFLQNRQGWLDETDSDSDGESKKKKEVKKEERVSESPAPKRGEKKRAGTVDDVPQAATNGARASRAAAGGGAVVEGMYRHDSGEVDVILTEGRNHRVVSLREAHDIAGFGLVQFLADRLQFQE